MPAWKLLMVAAKARRTWNRLPAEQRRRMIENVGTQARRHGPVIARQISAAVKNARKR